MNVSERCQLSHWLKDHVAYEQQARGPRQLLQGRCRSVSASRILSVSMLTHVLPECRVLNVSMLTHALLECRVLSFSMLTHALPECRVDPADVEKVGDSFCLKGQPDAKVCTLDWQRMLNARSHRLRRNHGLQMPLTAVVWSLATADFCGC